MKNRMPDLLIGCGLACALLWVSAGCGYMAAAPENATLETLSWCALMLATGVTGLDLAWSTMTTWGRDD